MPLPSQSSAITPDLRKSGKTPVCALLPQADLSGLDLAGCTAKAPARPEAGDADEPSGDPRVNGDLHRGDAPGIREIANTRAVLLNSPIGNPRPQ
ncbi:MAG: hypothetical protein ACPHAS_09575, partial [Synechococcus sp.]